MFDFLFGWSKASKCKKVIKRARCRLKLLKNKRLVTARQLRKDVAELIKNGYQDIAVNRVEQVIKDESLAAAYELLDQFCEFILTQLSYIRRHKDCPNDINEAVSSLIFASARCGDVPELCLIRKYFRGRYGDKFATTAVELYPGNLVNYQLKENLSGKSVPDDLKYRVVDEIARDYCIQPKLLTTGYYPDWQQVKENKGYQIVEKYSHINDTIVGSEINPSEVEEIEGNVICINSSIKSFLSKPSDSCSLQESSITNTSAIISTVQQYPPYILSFPLQKNLEKVENIGELLNSFTTSGLKDMGERLALVSSVESSSLPPCPNEMVDYVDNREVSRREPEKKTRRRSASLQNLGIMDIGYMLYHNHKPRRSPSADKIGTHHSRKDQKLLLEAIPQSSNAQKRMKKHSSFKKEKNLHSCQSQDCTKKKSFNPRMCGCSLDYPCYFCVYDGKFCLEALPMNPRRGIIATHIQHKVLLGECCHCPSYWNEELHEKMEMVTIPQRSHRKSYNGAALYNVFTYPDCQIHEQNEIKAETFESEGSFASSHVANPRTSACCEDKMLRTYSSPHHPNHVHPKLPDYDDLAATFTALKRELLGAKKQLK